MPTYRSIRLTHTIEIDGDPDEILALMTPEGERLWVPGWAPEYLDDGVPDLAAGVVFVTRHKGETTLWSVGELDHEGRRYTYHRFTPGSRVALVSVACAGNPGGPTTVDVSYAVTSLSDDGDLAVAAMERGFAGEIEGWKDALQGLLGRLHGPSQVGPTDG